MSNTELLTREEFQASMESLLGKIETIANKPITDNSKWLRTAEASEYLSISQSQLHSLKAEGIISCSKLGGTNYYDREELDQLLEENKNQV